MSMQAPRSGVVSLETPRLITVLLIATVLTMQVSLLNHVRVLGVMPDASMMRDSSPIV